MESTPLSTVIRIYWPAYLLLTELAKEGRRTRAAQLSVIIEEWAAAQSSVAYQLHYGLGATAGVTPDEALEMQP